MNADLFLKAASVLIAAIGALKLLGAKRGPKRQNGVRFTSEA